ncbi:unnamed protein product [Haemonchus placei]|uniref:Uncharacterized protein n=1 Tax=Haemonchus placei TaxID=6290 RepID=A0A0N4X3T5_HAEPC|nr:unnamed protein product [Haemonchus placei]
MDNDGGEKSVESTLYPSYTEETERSRSESDGAPRTERSSSTCASRESLIICNRLAPVHCLPEPTYSAIVDFSFVNRCCLESLRIKWSL